MACRSGRGALLRGDRGAGSLLGVAIIASIVTVTLALAPLYTVLVAKRETAASADAAALAAADVAIGIVPDAPCDFAASVAAANGTVLDACELEGVIVTVRVSASVLGFTVPATATAGPPGALRN